MMKSLRIASAIVFALLASMALAANPEIVSVDLDGHGMLCRVQGKRLLIVSGTPEQMGEIEVILERG